MIEEELTKLKKEYKETQIPQYLIYNGWVDVRLKLMDRSHSVFWFLARRIALAVLFLALIFTGVVTTSQAAAPGDFLYPVKVAGQNLLAKVSGDYQKPIQNRTQDVIKSSGGTDGNLDEAIKQYENTLNQSKNHVQDQQSREQFKKTLEEGQQQLRQAQEENKNQIEREKLQQVIEKTNEIQGDIKGAIDNHGGSQQEQNKSGED
jgi:Skp family chaperone for outer membrane proteins